MYNKLEERLSGGQPYICAVQGKSMLPFLREGIDHVDIRPITKTLKKYDVVFYKRKNGQYVLHRLIVCRPGHYVMRGDNQYKKEFGITRDMCIGILHGFWKNAGTSKEKYISVCNFSYKCTSILWVLCYPIRLIIRYIYAIVVAIFKKTERKNHT